MLKWLMLFVYFIVGVYVLHRIIYWFKIVTPLFKHRGVQGICVALYCIAASTIFFGFFRREEFRPQFIVWEMCGWDFLFIFLLI